MATAGKPGKDEKVVPRGKLPADLQSIVDGEDDFIDELFEGRHVEKSESHTPQAD